MVVTDQSGLEKVVLQNAEGSSVEVCLHGAHVASFKHKGEEVIFVSKEAILKPPTAIRGGVPVCWPQFSDMGPLPSHGFARNSMFSVAEESSSRVVLVLHASEPMLEKWSFRFELSVTVELTDDSRLVQTLEVNNISGDVMRFTNALHSYFKVSDISAVKVTGLEGCSYHDNLDGRALKEGSQEPITFAGETDRIYVNTGETICIHDEGAKREITISKSNFSDAVVWNPWTDKAKSLKDFGDEEYHSMLCVEPANAALYLDKTFIEVQPGEKWSCQQTLSVKPL